MTPFDLRKRIRHAIVVFFHFTLNSAFEPFGPHSFSHLFRSGGQRTSGYPYEFKWSMMNDDESIHPRSMSNAASLTAPTQPHSAGLTHKSKKMRHISSLDEIISSYSTFFIDMWGVLHNGSRPYDGVLHAISQLKSHGKQLVILSNSSKRRTHSIEMLSKLGFNPNDFEDVITSGEVRKNCDRQAKTEYLNGVVVIAIG